MKNEHLVWAYGEREDGAGQVVIIGLTDDGLEYLREHRGEILRTNPPLRAFTNVTQIAVLHEKDKATLKQRLSESGVVVSEVN
jgi:DNA-binding PadR family transcriptional regulator